MKNVKIAVVAMIASVLSMGVASAAGSGNVDVSAVVSSFQSDSMSAISLIGIALVTLAGVAVTYKWIKGTFFS